MKIKDNFTIKGRFKIKTFKTGTKKLLRETDWIDNLIVLNDSHGLYLVLDGLLGVETYTLEVTKGKIGYGSSTPVSADTDIETLAVDNILLAQKQRIDNDEINFIFFMSDADLPTSGTPYTEFGVFCEGQLFARSLISPSYSKSSGEDTQIDYTFTVTNT